MYAGVLAAARSRNASSAPWAMPTPTWAMRTASMIKPIRYKGAAKGPSVVLPRAEHKAMIAPDLKVLHRVVQAPRRPRPSVCQVSTNVTSCGSTKTSTLTGASTSPTTGPWRQTGRSGTPGSTRTRCAPERPVAVDDVAVVGRIAVPGGTKDPQVTARGSPSSSLTTGIWEKLIDHGDEHTVADHPPRGGVDSSQCLHSPERVVRRRLHPVVGFGNPHPQRPVSARADMTSGAIFRFFSAASAWRRIERFEVVDDIVKGPVSGHGAFPLGCQSSGYRGLGLGGMTQVDLSRPAPPSHN